MVVAGELGIDRTYEAPFDGTIQFCPQFPDEARRAFFAPLCAALQVAPVGYVVDDQGVLLPASPLSN